jgi:hypothetical protein
LTGSGNYPRFRRPASAFPATIRQRPTSNSGVRFATTHPQSAQSRVQPARRLPRLGFRPLGRFSRLPRNIGPGPSKDPVDRPRAGRGTRRSAMGSEGVNRRHLAQAPLRLGESAAHQIGISSCCMGLFLRFLLGPSPRVDGADDRLSSGTHMNVLDRNLLLPLAAVALESLDLHCKGSQQLGGEVAVAVLLRTVSEPFSRRKTLIAAKCVATICVLRAPRHRAQRFWSRSCGGDEPRRCVVRPESNPTRKSASL